MNEPYFAIDCKLSDLNNKVEEYYEGLYNCGHTRKIQTSFYFFYGKGDKAAFLHRTGSQGQNKELMVNDYGSLVEHVLTLITTDRPSFDVRCTNTDYKSIAQAVLGEQILEYYMRENKVEKLLKRQCDYALKYSEGFLGLDWDTGIGRPVGMTPDERPMMSGDIRFNLYNPLQVIRDIRNSESQDWVILVKKINRYELAAKFTNQSEQILATDTKPTDSNKRSIDFLVNRYQDDKTDAIPVYTFYHKKSMALPEGRMCTFIETAKLTDGVLPYEGIPITRMAPKDFDETCLGYTPMWNLLGIQDASDRLYSAILSNNIALARQLLQTSSSSDINPMDLGEGLMLLETDAEIKAIQLTKSSPEAYQLIEMLKMKGQEFSGVNEVIRGTPGPNLRSGNALVVVAAQAITYNSGMEHSYNTAVEDAGTLTLRFLKQFAEHPRFSTIVGKYKKAYLKEFNSEDLNLIDRVTVERRNPVMSTTAGKIQMAENLLQNGILTNAEQYLMVVETGSLDPMTEPAMVQLMLIKDENEKLAENKAVIAILTDDHKKHIDHHATILSNVESRFQPEVVKAVLDHIQSHMDILQTTPPEVLAILGLQPMQPPQGGGTGNAQLTAPNSPDSLKQITDKMPNTPQGTDAITQGSYEKMVAMNNQGV